MKSHTILFLAIAFLAILVEKTTYARLDFDSIDKSGFYRLSDDLDNTVTISVGDVTFDLGGHTIAGTTSGIVINSGLNQVTIQNGVVEAAQDAILVNGGCTNIQLKNITAKNAIRGINLDGVADSTIIGCEMTQNTTGLELDSSHEITVKDCIASRNTHGGYCLLSSSTNTFENCKALDTGEGNNDLFDTTIFGFVTSSGYGNVFERCIANATQGLTTTAADSLIAGFAFRGTEQCSKIIGSEASNSTSAIAGITLPHGILLEARFDALVSVTAVNPDNGDTGDSVRSVSWSPDGKYLAVGGTLGDTTGNDLFLYRFDRSIEGLIQVDSLNPDNGDTGDSVRALDWSPDGKYLAVGGAILGTTGNDLFLYRFDRRSETLTEVTSLNPDGGSSSDDIRSVDWTPDGKYLAVGGAGGGSDLNALFLYRFDRNTETLAEVEAINPGGGGSGDTVVSLNWLPDGEYLAVGGLLTGDDLLLFRFNRDTEKLVLVDSLNPDGGASDVVRTVKWSFDGKYLAVGGDVDGTTNNDLFMFRFDRDTETLIQVDSLNPDEGSISDQVREVDWSADGNYLAVAGQIVGTTGNDLFMFKFDRNTETLIEVDAVNPDGGSTADNLFALNWAPDGEYLAIGGEILDTTNFDLFVFRALEFPEKNIIKDNTIYCNSGNSCPGGVGISGSSIANLIIGNTVYANPIDPPIITTNYQFVTNIFAQRSGLTPSILQNISIGCNEPVCQPDDMANRSRRIELLIESLIENLL